MRAQVKETREVAKGTLMVVFDLLGREVDFRPGQYFWVTLLDPPYDDEKGNRRHISVVTSPNERGVLGLCGRRARVVAVQATVEHQALEHVACAVGPAQPADHPGTPLPGAHQHEVTRVRTARIDRSPRPNSGSATRKRPRFSSTATSGWSSRLSGGLIESARAACRALWEAPRRGRCRGCPPPAPEA